MKQPTPQQRHVIYMMALAQVKKKKEAFTCNEIATAYEWIMYGNKTKKHLFETTEVIELFPEHKAQRPELTLRDDVWFDLALLGEAVVKELRITLLLQCLIANQLSQQEALINKLK